ncbi:MAG: c-type cytochrome [Gemmatimonadota bacterium]
MRRMTFRALTILTAGALALTASSAGATQTQEGKAVFDAKCLACHSVGSDRVVGPGLEDITNRRDRAWLVSFISDPALMLADGDTIATRLLAEYLVPMPDLGLTDAEVEAVIAYLAEPAAAPSANGAAPAPAGDPAAGRALFTGERQLAAGGPACSSCHSANAAGLSGGTLAKDLSQVSETYGVALPGVLKTTPFPVMQDIFAARPLTDEEIADITALLLETPAPGAAAGSVFAFPASGAGGAIVLLLLAGFVWRGRLRGVRKPLIGGHR